MGVTCESFDEDLHGEGEKAWTSERPDGNPDFFIPKAANQKMKRKRHEVAADLVRTLIIHRETRDLDCCVAPVEQPAQTDVWGLCSEYVEQDFDAMDDDHNRNAAYARAFSAVPASQVRSVYHHIRHGTCAVQIRFRAT